MEPNELFVITFEPQETGERELVGIASTRTKAEHMMSIWAYDRFDTCSIKGLSWTSFQGRTEGYEVKGGAFHETVFGIMTVVQTEPDLMLWRREKRLTIMERV